MRKKELQQRIAEEYRNEAPDLREKILASCESEAQVLPEETPIGRQRQPLCTAKWSPVIALAACLVLFVSGVFAGMFFPIGKDSPVTASAESFIYLDVNPSIELQIDDAERVLCAIAINKDAEKILSELELEGVEMNTALSAIVSALHLNGYLTEESNSILISVDSEKDDVADALLKNITGKINRIFADSELKCSIIAQHIDVDSELLQRAKENNVSVGKMKLVDKMVDGMEDYGPEDAASLADMPIKDLNLIYSKRPDEGHREDPFEKDVVSGIVGGFIEEEDALTSLLTALGIDPAQVEHYEIRIGISDHGDRPRATYTLLVKFKDDDRLHEYEVDCRDGELIEENEKSPQDNPNENSAPSHSHRDATGKDVLPSDPKDRQQ